MQTDCPYCQTDSGIFSRHCAGCCARYCLTLPSKEAARASADRWCDLHGLDRAEVSAIGKRLARERLEAKARVST